MFSPSHVNLSSLIPALCVSAAGLSDGSSQLDIKVSPDAAVCVFHPVLSLAGDLVGLFPDGRFSCHVSLSSCLLLLTLNLLFGT